MAETKPLQELIGLLDTYKDVQKSFNVLDENGLYTQFNLEIKYIEDVIRRHYPEWAEKNLK